MNNALITEARDDFERFLAEYDFTAAAVRAITENTADQIPMPEGFDKVRLQPSSINGMGMFATCEVDTNEVVAPGRVGVMRTPVGRYTNHSPTPNAYFFQASGGDVVLVAKRRVTAGEELTIDYRQAGSVNGNNHPLNRAEMLKTVKRRFQHLGLPEQTDKEHEGFLDAGLAIFGYLPSIPDFLDLWTVNEAIRQKNEQRLPG
ncbi:SET domain-containing protein [Methylomonas rhizoryzae]|uniref:SET domain-containing protein n=1 Tax=Methylomonas rhizoryzae TaxID=2608981 RepID=UPI00123252A2|nr:SET domain-containing protein [Methylomonas rhizoryzae]